MLSRVRLLCCMFCLFAYTTFLRAQESGWQLNVRDYQFNMTAYVQLVVDGTPVEDYSNYELAAFVGNDCRGIAVPDSKDGYQWLQLMMYSNTPNETIGFKVYDKEKARALKINETVTFADMGQVGMPSSPMNMTMKMYTLGDVNDDGFIDIADVTSVLTIMAGKGGSNLIEEAADVNEDGYIDIADVTSILSIMAGK